MKSLHAQQHELAQPLIQLKILNQPGTQNGHFPPFDEKIATAGFPSLRPRSIETMQITVGYMCNPTCAHCHVDAGPDRQEIMTRSTMQQCLDALDQTGIHTVDLTGGAPEMNPHFRWLVEQVRQRGRHVIVRSNLTILTVNKKYRALPEFFARHGLEVVSSLPCYTAENTDKQRGDGVFAKSIEALQMLNAVGYGKAGSGLELNLVYNPLGAFLPPKQEKLEQDYKKQLGEHFGIVFNKLLAITNLPISRFLDYLLQTGKYEQYMQLLIDNFNPSTVAGVMCRDLISVGWDGYLYDCDFNQMLETKVDKAAPQHIKDFDKARLEARNIVTGRHCYGCTAGAGSSCGGELL